MLAQFKFARSLLFLSHFLKYLRYFRIQQYQLITILFRLIQMLLEISSKKPVGLLRNNFARLGIHQTSNESDKISLIVIPLQVRTSGFLGRIKVHFYIQAALAIRGFAIRVFDYIYISGFIFMPQN